MKKIEEKLMSDILKVVGEEPTSANHLPSTTEPLSIVSITMDKYEVRDDPDDRNKITASGDWAKCTFSDGGVLSLNAILRSPDLTWENLPTNKDRINALGGVKLHYTYQESLTSKAGRPYKRTHFVPQTIGASK